MLLIEFLVITVVLFAAVLLSFRFLVRFFGIKDLMDNGAVLTEDGIEYLRPFWAGRGRIDFRDIESARVVSPSKGLLSLAFFGYGFSVYSIRSRFFSDFVELRIRKKSRWFEPHFDYLLFTPKNAATFVEQLKSHLEDKKASN